MVAVDGSHHALHALRMCTEMVRRDAGQTRFSNEFCLLRIRGAQLGMGMSDS